MRVASDVVLALRVFPSLQHTHRIVRALVVKLGSHLTDLALVETEDGINDTLGLISLPCMFALFFQSLFFSNLFIFVCFV